MDSNKFVLSIVIVFLGVGASFGQTVEPKSSSDVTAKNKQIQAENAAIMKAFDAGNAAFTAKKYAEAIDILSAAINANPEHPGAVSLMVNLATAMWQHGVEIYNASVLLTDKQRREGGMATGLLKLREAEQMANSSAMVLQPYRNDPSQKDAATALSLRVTGVKAGILYSLIKMDISRRPDAAKALTEYIAAETNRSLRVSARIDLATLLLEGGDLDEAVEVAETILSKENEPRNPDALYIKGMSFAADSSTREIAQAGADHLKLFLSTAPANHPKRKDATETLHFIKESFGIAPK